MGLKGHLEMTINISFGLGMIIQNFLTEAGDCYDYDKRAFKYICLVWICVTAGISDPNER